MNISKANYEAALQRAHHAGYEAGILKGRQVEREVFNVEKNRAVVQLISAVGQALNTQSATVEGLARVLDNLGAIRP